MLIAHAFVHRKHLQVALPQHGAVGDGPKLRILAPLVESLNEKEETHVGIELNVIKVLSFLHFLLDRIVFFFGSITAKTCAQARIIGWRSGSDFRVNRTASCSGVSFTLDRYRAHNFRNRTRIP